MSIGSEPIVVRGRRIEAVHVGPKRSIVFAASETSHDGGVQAPEHVANLIGRRVDQGEHDREPIVRSEGTRPQVPTLAALLIDKTAGLDLREARGPDPIQL